MLVQQISQFTNMAHQWLWGSGKCITSSPGLGARLMGASAPTPSPQSCGHIQAKAAPLRGRPPLTGRAGVRRPAHPCEAWDEAWDTCGPGRSTGGLLCLFFLLLSPSCPSFLPSLPPQMLNVHLHPPCLPWLPPPGILRDASSCLVSASQQTWITQWQSPGPTCYSRPVTKVRAATQKSSSSHH